MTTQLASNQIKENPTKNFTTLASCVADVDLVLGEKVRIADRADGIFDVVLASGVTPNTYNIVQCTGVGTLALVLRQSDIYTVYAAE